MQTLKVTPAQLRSKANEFDSEANKLKSTTQKMMTLINGINGSVWSGDAAKAYKGQFAKLEDDNRKMYNKVHEYSTDLDAIAKEYDKVEQENQAIAQSLATDVIN